MITKSFKKMFLFVFFAVFVFLLSGCDPVFNSSTLRASLPNFSSPSGFYTEGTELEIYSITPNCEIYYTSDGTTPSKDNGLLYKSKIVVDKSTNIKAIAVRKDLDDSSIAYCDYLMMNKTKLNDYDSSMVSSSIDAVYENAMVAHICYISGTYYGKLIYLTNKSGTWTKEILDDSTGCSNPKIAKDLNGNFHITYTKKISESDCRLLHLSGKAGNWSSSTIQTETTVFQTKLVILTDTNSNPVVISDMSNKLSMYVKNGSSWSKTEILSSFYNNSNKYDAAIDSKNSIHLVTYTDYIKIVNGSPLIEKLEYPFQNAGKSPEIKFTKDNNFFICGAVKDGTMFYTKTSGKWNGYGIASSVDGKFMFDNNGIACLLTAPSSSLLSYANNKLNIWTKMELSTFTEAKTSTWNELKSTSFDENGRINLIVHCNSSGLYYLHF